MTVRFQIELFPCKILFSLAATDPLYYMGVLDVCDVMHGELSIGSIHTFHKHVIFYQKSSTVQMIIAEKIKMYVQNQWGIVQVWQHTQTDGVAKLRAVIGNDNFEKS